MWNWNLKQQNATCDFNNEPCSLFTVTEAGLCFVLEDFAERLKCHKFSFCWTWKRRDCVLIKTESLKSWIHISTCCRCIIAQCLVTTTICFGLRLKTFEHVLLGLDLSQAVCLEQQESSPSLAPHCQVPSLWSTTQPSEPSTLPEQAGLNLEVWVPWACQLLWLPTPS